MTMTARLTRSLLIGLVVVGLSGCSRTIRISDLLDKPQEYDGKTVQVEGTVTQSAGVLGSGAYEIDDGTGKIYVVARRWSAARGREDKSQGPLRIRFQPARPVTRGDCAVVRAILRSERWRFRY